MFFFNLMQDEHLDATWFRELLLAEMTRTWPCSGNWNIVTLLVDATGKKAAINREHVAGNEAGGI